MTTPTDAKRRATTLLLLFILLSSLYLITYSGTIETGDTRFLFDATSSFVDHGDTLLDLSAWMRPPVTFDPSDPFPLQNAGVEPLQVIASAPLYALAKILPFGLVHTVWLFNIFIGAAACCLIYLYAAALGYSERTSVLAALLFGVGTAIFPYTRTFFREPLALFMLLCAGYSLERWRIAKFRAWGWLIMAVLAALGMLLTKASMLLALPALVILALPTLNIRLNKRMVWRVFALLLITGAAVFILLIAADALPGAGGRYDILARLRGADSAYFWTALQSYLLSPGGSIWGTSPVLLLALPGAILSLKTGRWRYLLAALLLTLAFAIGYAILSGEHWFGGLSSPPRFLIPILPFWLILSLPALDRLANAKFSAWSALGLLLIVYSVWVQLSGVTFDLTVYPAALPPESNGLIEWSGGLNDPRWFRWVLLPAFWGRLPLDFAWSAAGIPEWAILFTVIVIICVIGLGLTLRGKSTRAWWWLILPVFLAALVVGLSTLHDRDDRFRAADESLFAAVTTLEAETNAGDVILLSSPRYESFFQNYGKFSNAGRVITLPLQPGEQSSPEQPPQVTAENPAALLNRYTISLIQNLAETRTRLWLLVDGSSELAWSVRPVERYMSAYFYPIRVIVLGDFTRLIEYSTSDAPNPFGFRGAEQVTDIVFGQSVRLLGFEINGDSDLGRRESLPISLYWATDAPLNARYTVAVYLRDANGQPITQHDYPPGGGFAMTDSWRVGVPVWDNRALPLPADLPVGEYQLWVKVYEFAPDGTVRDLPVIGGEVLDNVIAVLPVTLTVED